MRTGCRGAIRLMERAHGGEQVVQNERLGQTRDAVRDHLSRPAGDDEASPGCGWILRLQRLYEVNASLRAEVGVDKDRVVAARVLLARFREVGRDIDLVPAGAERAGNKCPHLVKVIDNQDASAI
jgi:hypothetical protein